MATTMQSPYAVPTTIDDSILTTSLADYQKRLVDNAYQDVVVFKLANEAGTKKIIDGGTSIVETLIKKNRTMAVFILALMY